jgi:PAS domain S-box-containing protein
MAVYQAVVGADSMGIVQFWPQGAERLFGYPAAEMVGRNIDVLVPEQWREAHTRGFTKAMERPVLAEVVLDVPILRADGQIHEHPVRIIAISDGFGTAVGAVAVFTSAGTTGTKL